MPTFTTAGSKVFIGSAKASTDNDLTASDLTAQTWVEISPVKSIGSFGDAAESVDVSYIGRARKMKMKGVRDAGNIELVCGLDYTNAGQQAMLAAEKTNLEFAFKIEFNDRPATGASPKPSSRMFLGIVMTATEELGEANSDMTLNTTISINTNVVKTNASAT